jgi:hypothetical protein
MRKDKSYFFLAGGKKFLNGDKPDQDTFEDLTDSVTFPKEVSDRSKVSEAGLSKTTIDTKVNAGDDTDQAGISPTGFTTFVKPSQLWRLTTSDSQVTLTPITRVPTASADSENGDLIQDIEISINPSMPTITVTDADNGLTLTGTIVELGGTLTKATTIDGGGYAFSLNNIDTFGSTGDFLSFLYNDRIDLVSNDSIKIEGAASFQVRTPNVVAATATVNQVLTLTNVSGAVEFQDVSLVGSDSIYTTDGDISGNRILNNLGFSITFQNGSDHIITNYTNIYHYATAQHQLTADQILLSVTAGTGKIRIATPNVNAGLASVGYVLTLSNIDGECEWTDVSGVITDTNIYDNNGTLSGNRDLNGLGNNLSFNTIGTFFVGNSTETITLVSDLNTTISAGANLVLEGSANLKLVPQNNATASNGDILVRQDATGVVTYQPQSYVQVVTPVTVIPTYSITNGDSILASVHGKGTQPSVEVWEDVSGGFGTQWNQVYVNAAGPLTDLILDNSGNVYIGAIDNTRIFRIIIKR